MPKNSKAIKKSKLLNNTSAHEIRKNPRPGYNEANPNASFPPDSGKNIKTTSNKNQKRKTK